MALRQLWQVKMPEQTQTDPGKYKCHDLKTWQNDRENEWGGGVCACVCVYRCICMLRDISSLWRFGRTLKK